MIVPTTSASTGRYARTSAALSATTNGFDALAEVVTRMQRSEPDLSRADLEAIDVPVTVVHAEHDEFIRAEHAAYVAASLPKAELVRLNGVSHLAPVRRPDVFDGAVAAPSSECRADAPLHAAVRFVGRPRYYHRPTMVRFSVPLMALLLLAACASAEGSLADGPTLAGCPVFPADHAWNVRVDALPRDPASDAYVAAIGVGAVVHPDFGAGLWEGRAIGIPFDVVGPGQAAVPVSFGYAAESDPGPYPIPPGAFVEGAPAAGQAGPAGGDRHALVLETGGCVLYELFDAERQGDGSWTAGSGAVFDLRGYGLRPDGWTSADAAGLPILPGLVRFDEVAAGEIRHALRFTAPRTRRAYVWPARHFASSLTDPALPPMGQRFRLRADTDLSGFAPEALVIARALQAYGMILADNGSAWFLSGAPDERWDDGALRDLRRLRGSDFEAVDASGLMVDPDSGRAASVGR